MLSASGRGADSGRAALEPSPRPPLPFPEFVALLAMLMAMSALGVDMMLPALPAIGEALGATRTNHHQFVITAFGAGFGASQLFHGPIVDRFGRRRILLWTLAAYAVINGLAAISTNFTWLILARFLSGSAVAGVRVSALAIIRDCYAGRAMARMLSLAFMVFMAFPILAPSFGAMVLLVGSWRWIFASLALLSVAVAGWVALRLPETLAPQDRRPIRMKVILAGWRMTICDRLSLGYTLAATGLSGALYGYLGSIQPIMAIRFGAPDLLLVLFAASAGVMMLANLVNARMVMRVGARRVSHAAICAMLLISLVQLAMALSGLETLVTFGALLATTMAAFALSSSNFSAIAMERMAPVAGTAASLQGFTSLTFGALIGAGIGYAFDGTTRPLAISFALVAALALALALITERGRLFRAA